MLPNTRAQHTSHGRTYARRRDPHLTYFRGQIRIRSSRVRSLSTGDTVNAVHHRPDGGFATASVIIHSAVVTSRLRSKSHRARRGQVSQRVDKVMFGARAWTQRLQFLLLPLERQTPFGRCPSKVLQVCSRRHLHSTFLALSKYRSHSHTLTSTCIYSGGVIFCWRTRVLCSFAIKYAHIFG